MHGDPRRHGQEDTDRHQHPAAKCEAGEGPGAAGRKMRSGRCRIPTFASMPSPSARARVYEVRNDPMIPSSSTETIGVDM